MYEKERRQIDDRYFRWRKSDDVYMSIGKKNQ